MEIDMSFDVILETEMTYNLNGIENTFVGSVHLIGYPNGYWTMYDVDGVLIEDPANRCEEFDLSQNPHTAKAVKDWLYNNREFCERADYKVMEEYYDHV